MHKLDEFTQSYVDTALGTCLSDNGTPLDRLYSVKDIPADVFATMLADCEQFQADNWEDISADLAEAGKDFWLTRNHHGAGFWDGDWEDTIGKRLTAASKSFPQIEMIGLEYGIAE